MSLAAATLDRLDRPYGDAPARPADTPSAAAPVRVDDDDLMDAWLASLSVDEFEHILSGLADLR